MRPSAFRYLAALAQVVVDLQTQFAGGHHDQRPRHAVEGPRGVGDDALQQRYAEGEGLAHAGAGLTDEVVAGERQRQGQFLDGEGVLDAVLGQCADDLLAHAEISERCRGFG